MDRGKGRPKEREVDWRREVCEWEERVCVTRYRSCIEVKVDAEGCDLVEDVVNLRVEVRVAYNSLQRKRKVLYISRYSTKSVCVSWILL